MFRQIWIHKDDQVFQKILWRFSTSEPIKEYQLATVTYGTRPAPYLAMKTLQHLATLLAPVYERGAKTVLNNFYMDDLLAGANSIEEARITMHETREILKSGGFNLRKWCSNNERVLKDIPADQQEFTTTEFKIINSVKTLGLYWNPQLDNFSFKVNLLSNESTITKRILLSETSKLFDPIGWLAPTIIKAKLIFQELWSLELKWDDKLPAEIATKWTDFRRELPLLEEAKITRWINYRTHASPCELHGFSDASEKAYAAVVYLRSYDNEGNVVTRLISAKTKVAPTKKKTSLPRLELCAALLLSKLMKKIVRAMELSSVKQYAWTDSEIVLAWLNGDPNKYKTFVANRISKINAAMDTAKWFHVKSKENPADVASRGINAGELIKHKLWWNGPEFLRNATCAYDKPLVKNTQEECKTKKYCLVTLSHAEGILEIVERFSSLQRACRVIGYCIRFVNNCRGKKQLGPLTKSQLQKPMDIITRAFQGKEFAQEIAELSRDKHVNSKSAILSLNPFLDEDGLLRVGGRLNNSELTYDSKHPVILPYRSHLTKLVISEAHKRTLHGGVNLTLAHTRNKYWILKGYSAVKQQLRTCVICARFNARTQQQLMANLPKPRLTLTRPFSHTGVDYAGPVTLKSAKGRGTKTYKGYIALFICLATKAIHLEAASDLSAEAFIAAFKRFIARRGLPTKIYSDNATNFQLASKILEKNQRDFKVNYHDKLIDELSNLEVEWSFIPPAAPHFGGLWETGVKSMKHHLKRTVSKATLTFEEMSTVLAGIEACLNSRPLCPLNNDATDLSVLTPGHFLIGTSLLAPPGKDGGTIMTDVRSRWKLLESLNNQFWTKWSTEYLHKLQYRPKWTSQKEGVQINDLVLIKDETLPPAQWALGRIEEIHPGKDNLVRVVTLRTRNKLVKRPITKICLLPVSESHLPNAAENTPKRPLLNNTEEIERKRTKRQIKIRPVEGYSNLVNSDNSKSNQSTSTSKRPMLGNMALLFIMALLLMPALARDPKTLTNITPFNNHPGIYFENLGTTQLIASKWSIIVYYDLEHYWEELHGLRNCIEEMDKLCNLTTVKRYYCTSIHEQFTRQLVQIQETNNIIHTQGSSSEIKTRNKRAPLNIIGKAANYLFGILDADYARDMDKNLNQVNQNENYLLELLKNQTSILDATSNIIKGDREAIRAQFEVVQGHIDDLLRHIHQDRTAQERDQLLNSLIAHTTLIFLNYERVQRGLVNILTDLHHGRIDPLIITPSQLKSQLNLIRRNIPHKLAPPEPSQQSGVSLYRLMTAAVRMLDSRILFEIRLPLFENEKYQLFHLVPVPTPYNQNFTFIEPETPYLIVDLQRENYYPLSQPELDKCTHLEDDQYLCERTHPMYNTNSRRGRCEMNMLRHVKSLSSDCRFRTLRPSKFWIQLKTPNTWLYVMDQEYTFNIICGTTVLSETLNGEGILKLSPECEIKQDSMTISAHGYYTTQLNSSFVPSINISQAWTGNQQQELNPIFPEQHWRPNNDAITEIREKIAHLQQKEQLTKGLSSHNIHHYTVNYLLLAIVIGLVIYTSYKYIAAQRQFILRQPAQASRPTAAARSWNLPSSELHI